MRLAVSLVAIAACGSGEPTTPAPIRFLHTFAASETELLNSTLAERGLVVESSLVPFARGHQVIGEILRAGVDCPELIRIDATWLPGLVAAQLLLPPPPPLASLDWSPDAVALGTIDGRVWGLPQTVDGLVVVRDASTPAPASPSLDDLVVSARLARTATTPHPLGVRVDGYWLVPWLRAEGAELAPGSIETEGAVRGLAEFVALFGDLAASPPAAGTEAPDELRRWTAHELAYWVTGPWQLGALRDRDQIAVSALARAPRGGQLLVVPRCAKRPADGWRLAAELTSVPVELIFSDAFATIPTRAAALAGATPLVHAIDVALAAGPTGATDATGARMLPRAEVTPLLFDDLNPALAAVVAGDATAQEAIEGVRRGWHRLVATAP